MIDEQIRRKEALANMARQNSKKSYYGSIKRIKGKALESLNATAKRSQAETIQEKEVEPK